jgi:acetylglutamate kinase
MGIESKFYGGHRKTDKQTMQIVEMVLRGKVGGDIVKQFNNLGFKAIGLSGKDGRWAIAQKRIHRLDDVSQTEIDLGFVGDIEKIDPGIIFMLLDNDYIPVISSIASGTDFQDYNINADLFAGHLAAALHSNYFIILTDVDGIKVQENGSARIVYRMSPSELEKEMGKSIVGGMIPKADSCLIAASHGVKHIHILNGTTENVILRGLMTDERLGTYITN